MITKKSLLAGYLAVLTFSALSVGCLRNCRVYPSFPEMPGELKMTPLPDHIIAPPDVLLINAVALVPRPPYKVKALDSLFVKVTGVGGKDPLIPGQPIEGIYRVESEGTINLGFDYGSVVVVGKQLPEVRTEVLAFLKKRFKGDYDVSVTLAESRAMQQISGEHLVQPDGKVNLGTYGSVYVTGLTVEDAKQAIQQHLSQFLEPEISLSIAGFNSRVYYVIFDLDGLGQQVARLPVTGNETVLDAVSELKGLPAGTCRKKIWVARPASADAPCGQKLDVNWDAVASGASTATNYQLLPGDRLFVSVDPLVSADDRLGKIIAPIERVLGITILGYGTIRRVGGRQGTGGGGGFGGGF